jgi:hypothetical protein
LLEEFFTPLELLEAKWLLCDEVDAVFLVDVDLPDAVAPESCGGLAAATSAQLSVSAQTAPNCALRNFAPGLIMPCNFAPKKIKPSVGTGSVIIADLLRQYQFRLGD